MQHIIRHATYIIYKMDPNLREWVMKYSKTLKSSLGGKVSESEFAEYFSDKHQDLVDLDAIMHGAREPRLWHVCNSYGLGPFVQEFVDKYFDDLCNGRRWDITEGIDTLLIDTLDADPEATLATKWLVELVQHNKRPYLDSMTPTGELRGISKYLKKIFAVAYTWSMELLTFALQDMKLDHDLATFIYNTAVVRGLPDVMKFAHVHDCSVGDGCDLAAKHGNVECLKLAHRLGGSIKNTCEYAAANGHVHCLQLAYELGGSISRACECAAANGHVECLQAAHELGGRIEDACDLAAENGHVHCLQLAYELGGRIEDACDMAAANGHVRCLQLAHELGGSIYRACDLAAANGHVECLQAAHELGGRIEDACDLAAANGHAECLQLAYDLGGRVRYSCSLAAENGHVECMRLAHRLNYAYGRPLQIPPPDDLIGCTQPACQSLMRAQAAMGDSAAVP